MMVFDPHDPLYWDSGDLQKEFTRVMDICNGCRLCDALCPPFTDIFDRIDEEDDRLTAAGMGAENPVRELKKQDYDHVVDYCYQCKLCYPKCPYTPPHDYMLDFPRLLLRADAIRVKDEGKTLKNKIRDEFLGDMDRTGKLGAAMPGITNWANTNPIARTVLEKTIGIAKEKLLPKFYGETFEAWFHKRGVRPIENPVDKVALFDTCQLNFNRPWVAKQFVEILERHNIQVIVPKQECCGMPELGAANIDKVIATVDRNINRFIPVIDGGYKVIAMAPSCSLMLRLEYGHYATDKEKAKRVEQSIFDPGEYLMQLVKKKDIALEFTESVGESITYHLACHLRIQNIGFPGRELLKLLPNTRINMIQQCSGHDGAWSMKQEYYQISLDVGKKLFKGIEKDNADLVASDCTLAHLHIHEGTGAEALHPIEILYRALGYTEHRHAPDNWPTGADQPK